MQTKCQIILYKNSGEISSILCTNDGHPPHMLPLLDNNYTEVSKIEDLLNLGNVAKVGALIHPEVGVIHNMIQPQKDVTISYNRDGKSIQGFKKNHSNFSDLKNTMRSNDVEWGYIYVEEHKAWFLIDEF